MSWNEPGGDKKDPWSGRKDQNNPPDLDEVVRSIQEKLGGLFGGGSGGGSSNHASSAVLGLVAGGALILWGLSGLYTVDQGTRGVVTRFGAYVETTGPGLNWHMPAPIERVEIVNVEQQRFIEIGYRSGGGQAMGAVPKESLMLTRDENIVDVRLAVQYQVKDAKDFAFNVHDPMSTLKQATESALRGAVGASNMDFVLTEGRTEIVAQIATEIQAVMDAYKAGIIIKSVNLQDVQPPEQVQGAFEDAIKSREDKQRLINEAEAYSNDVIPRARGAASRLEQEAEGYRQRAVAQAEGDTSRFTQLLTEYKKAPAVTRQRMFIETMEGVLDKTSNVFVDVKASGNLMYLPLDKLGSAIAGSTAAAQPQPAAAIAHEQPAATLPAPFRDPRTDIRASARERDVRGR
ncbi:MAG: FtsH protease activity modulator HflK [Methylomonas sp.]|nr:FtsH protease activity modulator HflK [Methylomonas sp.]PPD22380.1 MAG: FtsH protease activity modulator HflK [Methylomonas sp.]PPD25850.1 MAG: FtsH protease activity modulator HflK [Methylomonas sp.]PPD37299.1 MAG: FtsH protease activity modulator HflK [Methylomonas sp.]PPD42129.1 MAG: FtsH protease activity modulator HflK [Methylomonas sp.]